MDIKKYFNKDKNHIWLGIVIGFLFASGCSTATGIYNSENNINTHNEYYDKIMKAKISKQKEQGKHIPSLESNLANSKSNSQRKYMQDYINIYHGKSNAENKLINDFGYKVANHDINLPTARHTHPISNYLKHSIFERLMELFVAVFVAFGGFNVLDFIKFHFSSKRDKNDDFHNYVQAMKSTLLALSKELKDINDDFNSNKSKYLSSKKEFLKNSKDASLDMKYKKFKHIYNESYCTLNLAQRQAMSLIDKNWKTIPNHNNLNSSQKNYIRAVLGMPIQLISHNTKYIRDSKMLYNNSTVDTITKAEKIMKYINS